MVILGKTPADHRSEYARRGEAMISERRLDEAETLFSAAVEQWPEDPWMLHHHANVATQRKEWNEALRRWELLRQRFPNHSSGYSGGGVALISAERLDEAEILLLDAVKRFPSDLWVLHHLADAATRRSDRDEAIRRWQLVRERFPDHKAAIEALSFFHNDNPDLQKYASMQKSFYDTPSRTPEGIVGNYQFHENFPYESLLLYKFGDVRRPIFSDFKNRIAFDIACGEGRMIRRMAKIFAKCDGADISSKMVGAARAQCQDSTIWMTSGTNCGDAPSDSYDFVFCTISLQHICVYETRNQINKDILRILKQDGKMTLQMLFSSHFPYVYRASEQSNDKLTRTYVNEGRHALYLENKSNALATNSGCDVVIGTQQLATVKSDLERYFDNIEFWFHDISIGRPRDFALFPEHHPHPNHHPGDNYWGTHYIFIHGSGPKK